MTVQSLQDLTYRIEETLYEAQDAGVDRLETAQRLEELADAVRDGHTKIPKHRGEWWSEVNQSDDGDAVEYDETRETVV